jgi:ABC-type glycerol-3-phosphate transport system substrate-binding protein
VEFFIYISLKDETILGGIKMKMLKLIAMLLLVLILAACGGGGGIKDDNDSNYNFDVSKKLVNIGDKKFILYMLDTPEGAASYAVPYKGKEENSKKFLKKIKKIDSENLNTTYIFKDVDNGHIIIINETGSIQVQ